jgi:drug/metabolite transporter (DMT)-like permease
MLAAANVVLDAYGSVLTKQFGVDFNTFEINFMRFGFASFVMAAIAIIASIIHKFYPGLNNQGPVLVSDSDTKFRELTQTSTHNALHHDDEEGHVQENAESPSYESSPDDKSTKLLWWQMPNEHIMNTKSWVYSSIGVIFVTFLCPALSNWALFRIPLGVCLTLTSVGPIYSLPLSVYVKKEAISPKGTIGAILAVAGVAILCFI